jgi:proteasome lid subunit RPN8/RPN11
MILTPVVITEDLIQEIVTIGDLRLPNEACGVLLPTPHRNKRVFEIPNRSKYPANSFEMHSDDIVMEIEDWIIENPSSACWEQVTIWHTHPSGGVGPSRVDLQNRIEKCGNLVISLGSKPVATWF